MSISKPRTILILAGLVITAGITAGQKVETKNGVRLIHNERDGIWGKNPELSLEFVRTIGELDSEDENLLFHMPADIAFDGEGNVYVLDSGNHRIQKFGPDGRYLDTLGRKGEGPGEFQMPLSLDIDRDGILHVSDAANQRIQKLHADGSDAGAVAMSERAGSTIRLLSDGHLLAGGGFGVIGMRPGGMEQEKEPPPPLKILDSEGNEQGELGDAYDYGDFLLNSMGNRFHFTVDRKGRVLIAFDAQNRIDMYSPDGALAWRSDRRLDYSTKPPGKKGKMERGGGMMMVQMPDMNRASSGVAVDGKDRIWVINYRRQIREDEKVGMRVTMNRDSSGSRSMALSAEGNTDILKTDAFRLEVYDAGGILLGAFPLDHFADDIRIYEDRIYILDRFRGARFTEYRIVE